MKINMKIIYNKIVDCLELQRGQVIIKNKGVKKIV